MWFCEIGLHVRTPLKVDSRYALRDVDLKDMVVIDLWNAGEQRPVETLSGGKSFLVSLSLALALLRTKQRALKAGIIVFGRGLWHTGQRASTPNTPASRSWGVRIGGCLNHKFGQ